MWLLRTNIEKSYMNVGPQSRHGLRVFSEPTLQCKKLFLTQIPRVYTLCFTLCRCRYTLNYIYIIFFVFTHTHTLNIYIYASPPKIYF